MMEDLALQQQRSKHPAEHKPPIDLPRVALRFVPRETKNFEALFGIPDLPLARRYLREQLYHRGVREEVLTALDIAPRHVFVPSRTAIAYVDIAIHAEHTFVQAPSVVATVVSTLASPDARVLELGTGTGYQSAVLAAFGAQVTTVDSTEAKQEPAKVIFGKLDLSVDTLVRSSGSPLEGLPNDSFDLIVVSEALSRMPRRLVPLLREGGSVVAPVLLADGSHRLARYLRNQGERISAVDLGPCFAPMVSPRRRSI